MKAEDKEESTRSIARELKDLFWMWKDSFVFIAVNDPVTAI